MPYADLGQRKLYYKAWRDKNKEYLKEESKKWRKANREYDNQRSALYHRRQMWYWRRALSNLLGGKCERCGYDDERTFQFHHRYGDGNAHRKLESRGRGNSSYYKGMVDKVKKDPKYIELLCANCHVVEHWIPDSAYTPGKKKRKFTEEEIKSIRTLHKKGRSIINLSKRFGVQRQTIRNIVNRTTHYNVE